MDIETMRYYYITGLWTIDRLEKLRSAGKITDDQYQEITAEAQK